MCLRTVTNSIYVHIQNIPHPHIRPYSILSVSILISIHWYDITFYMHEFMLYYFVESNTMRDFAYIWRWFGKNSLWIPFVCSRRSGDDLSSIHNFHDTMRLKWFLAKQFGSTEKTYWHRGWLQSSWIRQSRDSSWSQHAVVLSLIS